MDVVTLGMAKADAKKKYAGPQIDRGREWLIAKKAIATREFYRCMALRDTIPATVMGLGDSISEGKGASSHLTRWTRSLGPALRSLWPTTGAPGHPAGCIEGATTFSPTYTDFPVAYTGTWTRDSVNAKGIGMTSVALSTGATVTLTVTGATAVDFYLFKALSGARSVTYPIDGGAASATISAVTTGAIEDMFATRVTLPNTGSHTITVTSTGTNSAGFSGWYVYNGNEIEGVRVFANGHSSYASVQYQPVLSVTAQAARVQPSLFLLEIGANDYQNGVPITAAAFKANLLAIIAAVRAGCTRPPSIVLIPA